MARVVLVERFNDPEGFDVRFDGIERGELFCSIELAPDVPSNHAGMDEEPGNDDDDEGYSAVDGYSNLSPPLEARVYLGDRNARALGHFYFDDKSILGVSCQRVSDHL
jgi:hypothetical protein